MKFNTKTIHGGQSPDKAFGSVMPPIYQTSLMLKQLQEGTKDMNIPELTTLPEMLLKSLLLA